MLDAGTLAGSRNAEEANAFGFRHWLSWLFRMGRVFLRVFTLLTAFAVLFGEEMLQFQSFLSAAVHDTLQEGFLLWRRAFCTLTCGCPPFCYLFLLPVDISLRHMIAPASMNWISAVRKTKPSLQGNATESSKAEERNPWRPYKTLHAREHLMLTPELRELFVSWELVW